MSDIELATIVAGVVAAIRKKFPDIDGAMVWALVALVSGIACLAYAPGNWRDAVQRAARVALTAIAGVSLGGYLAGKTAPTIIGLSEPPQSDRESPTRPDIKSIPPPSK